LRFVHCPLDRLRQLAGRQKCENTFLNLNSKKRLFSHPQYAKISRVQCSTSGKTCANFSCKLKPISRNETLMNFNCDLKRNLTETTVPLGNVSIYHRLASGFQFRQIVKLEKMNVCDLSRNVGLNPWYKELLTVSSLIFPGLMPEKCPISGVRTLFKEFQNNSKFLQQTMQVINGSMLFKPKEKDQMHNSGFGTAPNGVYKVILGLFDKLDGNIIKLNVTIENDFRTNIYSSNNW
jgi:hypothetical protein